MRKYNITMLILLALIVACTPQKKFKSYWNSSLEKKLNLINNKGAVLFQPADEFAVKVFNNAENLDVILTTNSASTLQKIYNLGLTVWLDPKGRQHNVFAVNFPMPVASPYTTVGFKNYLQQFSRLKLQSEFADKFTAYETIDTRTQEHTDYNTLMANNPIDASVTATNQVLFKYRLTIPLKYIYGDVIPKNATLSIGVASINEPDAKYYSELSSKQVIQQNLSKLTVTDNKKRQDLEEWWSDFILASE